MKRKPGAVTKARSRHYETMYRKLYPNDAMPRDYWIERYVRACIDEMTPFEQVYYGVSIYKETE